MTTVRTARLFGLASSTLILNIMGCHRLAARPDDSPTLSALIEDLTCQGDEKLRPLNLASKQGHLITVRTEQGFNNCDIIVLDRYVDGDRLVCDRTTWDRENDGVTKRVYSAPAGWAHDGYQMTKQAVVGFRPFHAPGSGSGPGSLFHVVPGESSPAQIHFRYGSRLRDRMSTSNSESDQRLDERDLGVLTQVLLDAQIQLFDQACADMDGKQETE